MSTITITLDDDQLARFGAPADLLGVPPEEVARLSILEFLPRPDERESNESSPDAKRTPFHMPCVPRGGQGGAGVAQLHVPTFPRGASQPCGGRMVSASRGWHSNLPARSRPNDPSPHDRSGTHTDEPLRSSTPPLRPRSASDAGRSGASQADRLAPPTARPGGGRNLTSCHQPPRAPRPGPASAPGLHGPSS